MTGYLKFLQNFTHTSHIRKSEEFSTVATKIKRKSNFMASCNKCKSNAKWKCAECNLNFCNICWDAVHISTLNVKAHLKLDITDVTIEKVENKLCSEHRNQYLEFYCNNGAINICLCCLMLKHQGERHCFVSLAFVNENLSEAARETKLNVGRMCEAIEKIDALLDNYNAMDNETCYSNLKSRVSMNFSRLHGLLQLAEEKQLRNLNETAECRENCPSSLREKLMSNFRTMSTLLLQYDESKQNSSSSAGGNLVRARARADLLDSLFTTTTTKKMLCYLISKIEEDIKIDFNEDLVHFLSKYCTFRPLPRLSTTFHQLAGAEKVQENVPPEEFRVLQEERDKGPLKMMPDSIAPEACDMELDKNQEIIHKIKALDLTQFNENNTYHISLNYIERPGEFYVTLSSKLAARSSIGKNICEFRLECPSVVNTDDVYLVRYKFDNKWYRVKVISVGPKACEYVTVFNLDYGNTRKVTASRLRHIPCVLLSEPPLAVKCKMFNFNARNTDSNSQSRLLMKRIVKWQGTIFVKKIHSDHLEVDLRDKYIKKVNDMKNILGLLEFETLKKDPPEELGQKNSNRISPSTLDDMNFARQIPPKTGETLQVVVTHVNSPSNFYVQMVQSCQDALIKVTNDLNNYYAKCVKKDIIYSPKVGMPCAARFSSTNMWCRAKVMKKLFKKLEILYVDYGNVENVDSMSVQKLDSSFLTLPPLAFDCALVETEVQQTRQDWKNKVGARLKSNAHEVRHITIERIIESDLKLQVSFCAWPKEDDGDDDSANNSATSIYDKTQCSSKEMKVNHEPTKEELTNDPFAETNDIQFPDGPSASAEKCVNSEDVFRPKIDILSATSPSSVYITFPELTSGLTKLHSQLNSFYEGSLPDENKKWTVGERCAAYSSSHCNWYRAIVLEILGNDQVKVFSKDTAVVFVESLSLLRPLMDSFLNYPPCAIQCHMSDVYPVANVWPEVSCEFLLNEIESSNEIYMTRKGEIKNGSLPIELWVRRKKVCDSNYDEMTDASWISLNNLLVDAGFALPLKMMTILSSVIPTKNIKPVADSERDLFKINEYHMASSDIKEKENTKFSCTSTSVRWLPAVPLKRFCFVGMPTFVNVDATIYLYDVEEDEDKVNHIKKTLFDKCRDSEPGNCDTQWVPGAMCIAKYHGDNHWYRGTVVKANQDLTYDILFVDYGNDEICTLSELRKDVNVEMTEIPILTHKFVLPGIKPPKNHKTWSAEAIDFLHSTIVDKKCMVTVLEHSDDPSQASIASMTIIEGNIDVCAYLESSGFARFDAT